MAFILKVYIIDGGDGTIKVGHEFYGRSVIEVETYCQEHLASCEYFAAAEKDDRVIEVMEEDVDESELPTPADFLEEEEE